MLGRWQLFDEVTRVLVALTATSSSAAAGLAIWSWPVFKQVWVVLASMGVVLSIISAALKAPERLKGWTASRQEFGGLYIELETFMFDKRIEMKINPEFSVVDFMKAFDKYRKRFLEAKQRLPNDIFATEAVANLSQNLLNERNKKSILFKS